MRFFILLFMLITCFIGASAKTYYVKSPVDLQGKTKVFEAGSRVILKGKGCYTNGRLKLQDNVTFICKNDVKCSSLSMFVIGKNIKLQGVSWECTNGPALLSYYDCDNLTLDKCTITADSDNCIKLVTDGLSGQVVTGLKIQNCKMKFKRMGIELQNHRNTEFRFDGATISGNTFSLFDDKPLYGFGISLSGYGRNVTVTNNNFLSAKWAIEIGFDSVYIQNNTFTGITDQAISSSGERIMKHIHILSNTMNCPRAKIFMRSTDSVEIKNNIINILFLELYGSHYFISNNDITSNGRYTFMFDGGNNSVVENNKVTQLGDNYAVFRCYGKDAVNNQFRHNTLMKKITGGVLFDLKNEAKGNTFVQ